MTSSPTTLCMGICQYDRRRFDPEVIKGVIMTHPLLVRGHHVYRNFYYVPPQEFLSATHADTEVRHWLDNLERERHTDEALRESEDKFRSLFERSIDMINICAPDGSGLEVNQAWLDLFGYTREELPGLNASDIYANPVDRIDFLRRIAEDGSVDDEVRLKKKDGTVRVCRRTAVARKDEQGNIIAIQGTGHDITARKQAEAALRESEETFRALFEASQAVILVLDIEGRIVRFNPYMEQISGYSLQEVRGKDWFETFLRPEDRTSVEALFGRAVRGVQTRGEVNVIVTKDGHEVIFEWHDDEMRDNNGNVVGLLAVGHDITDQRLSQQALKESEEKYRSLFEQSADVIYICTPEGATVDANPAWLNLFGYSPDELRSFNAASLYADPKDREDFLRRIAETGVVKDEVRFKKKDGTVIVCQRTAVARKDQRGKVVAYQSTARDITERKRAEEALRRSEAYNRSIVEVIPDLIVRANARGELLDVTASSDDKLAVPRDEIAGKTVADILSREDALRAEQAIKEALRTRSLQTMEYQLEVPSGKRWFECRFSPSGTGEVVALIRDITERKSADEALRESEERFRALFEQSMDPINIVSADGLSVEANKASLDLFGYSRDEMRGLRAADFYADPREREDFLRRIADPGFVQDEVRFKKKDGTVVDCIRNVVIRRDLKGDVVAYQTTLRDVTERNRMERRIEAANRELKELAARLESAREEERAEVAWELHDHVAQALSVLKVDLHSCRSKLSGEALTVVAPTMDRMTGVLDDTVERLRRLYAGLAPVMLEDLGLAATIEWQTGEFSRQSGIECELRRVEDIKVLRGRVALGLFRVLQEALDNVRRHSGATKVTVDFECDGSCAVLRIADNGRGFTQDEGKKPGAIGLTGIRERVQSWGGKLVVNSTVGSGTVLEVTAPLEDGSADKTLA